MTRWNPSDSVSHNLSKSLSFSAANIRWLRNGKYLLVTDRTNNNLVKFEASTPWELGSLTEINSVSLNGQPTKCFRVHPSESTFIVSENDTFTEYFLGNNLDFSSKGEIGTVSVDTTNGTIQWNPNGREFSFIDYPNAQIKKVDGVERPFRYDNISNLTQSAEYSISATSTPIGYYAKDGGINFYILDDALNLYKYEADSAWNYSSLTHAATTDLASATSISKDVSRSLDWKLDGSKFYIATHNSGGGSPSIDSFTVPVNNKLYSVWETSAVEENVSYDEIFQTEHKQLAYDHENFSEISPDPASCWPLQEKSNKSTAVDVAGDNDLSIASDVSQDRPAVYSRTAMRMPNDYSSSSLNNNAVSNLSKHSFTICLWSRYRSVERENLIDIDEQEIDINRGINDSPIAFTYNTNTITDRTITHGDRYFFSYRYNSSEETMYADAWDITGNKVATASQTGVTALSEEFANHIQIGSQITGSYNYSSADEIFEVRWYNEKLSETQLEKLGSVIWGPKFTQDKQKHSRLTTGPDHARTYKEDEETSKVIPTPDIYMPFHETEGTTAHDIIGVKDGSYGADVTLGRDGVRGGNAVYLTSTGSSGNAMHLDNPKLELATRTSFETVGQEFGSGQLSGGFWYYRTEQSSGDIFHCDLSGTTEGGGYIIREVTDGFEMSALKNVVSATDTSIENGKWYYIAHNWHPYEATSQYLYIYDKNGLVVSDTNGSSGQQDDGDVADLIFYYCGGKVCNFRFYNDLTSETSFEKIVESTGGPSYWSGRPVQL